MKIAVFGLGYVGLVSALCHASDGHLIWGVDNDPVKLQRLRAGLAPIREPGLEALLSEALESDRLRVTRDSALAVAATDLALICVGTPTSAEVGTDLSFVVTVARQIGAALANTSRPYTVVLRSTVPPGTTRGRVLPALQAASGRTGFDAVRLYFNPEFLRQGSALHDFRSPPFVVFGTASTARSSPPHELSALYPDVDAQLLHLSYEEAELLKLSCNSFHALKIAFANEIGTLAEHLSADPSRVMEVFMTDTKLNLSPSYLRPGFAFGGSCLPKEVRSINHLAAQHRITLPLHGAILTSNDAHLDRAVAKSATIEASVIGVLGLVFKPNTDDLRESPSMRLVDRLLKLGKEVLVYEPEIDPDLLIGANRKHFHDILPDHADKLLDWESIRRRADLLLITREGVVSPADLSELRVPFLDLTRLGDAGTPPR